MDPQAKTMCEGVPELKTYSATGNKGSDPGETHMCSQLSSSESKAKAPSTASLPTPAPNNKHAKPANPGSNATKP
ncbi:hypothetical protein ZWY2020_037564 [Hordeum vulgare]|nr:hypothetical protein ZWY2020_037564 [Hordeum vulgare]